MKPRNILWVTLAIFAVVLGVLVGGFVRTGRAQSPDPQTVTCRADFPFMGLVGKEQARIHTSWVDGQGDPISVRTVVFDRNGLILMDGLDPLPVSGTVTVRYDPKDRTDQSPRIQFRASVILAPSAGGSFPADPGCPDVIATLERTSSTGAQLTVVAPSLPIGLLQPVRPSPAPSSPPDVGLVDAAGGVDVGLVDASAPDVRPPDASFPPPDAPAPPPASAPQARRP